MIGMRLAAGIALLLAQPVFARTDGEAAKLVAARELLKASDIQGQMKLLGPRVAEGMGAQIRQMFEDSKVPEGLGGELTAATQAYVATMDSMFTPELIDRIAVIYARHFSVDELEHLTAMLEDPLMVRFRNETPGLLAEMMPVLFEAMRPSQQKFQERIKQIVVDWINQHPADRAKLRSPTSS
jgi:hypothetical protein